MTLRLITAPAEEPVTLAQVKLDAFIDDTDTDSLITPLITMAREEAEAETGRALITQTWELVLPSFPESDIKIGKLPIQSITSVKYYDSSNVQQTLSASYYTLDTDNAPGFARLNYSYSWPSTYERHDAVIVRFFAGYGDTAADVPPGITAWIRQKAAYEADRGKGQVKVSEFVDRALDQFRLYRV